MMLFESISFRKNSFLDLRFRTCYKVVLLKQHVVSHKTECPDINFRTISLLSENLRWHKDWGTNNFFVNLFFNCKPEVSQLVQNVGSFLFQEYIVWLDISVYDIIFWDELNATSKLVDNFEGLGFRQCTLFIDDLFKISIGAKLQNHGNIVLRQKTIINFGREHSIWISAKRKLS